jgi:hypothetical protein
LTVSNDFTIRSNCWVYPISYFSTNGASLYFEASNLTIQATAGINADSSGYAVGYGPGRTLTTTRTGGGYGGYGQYWSATYGGLTYGSSNAPVDPGSPGQNGKGGGLIRVAVARTVVNNGTLTANGQAVGNDQGAGAGGGIFIQCRRWEGVATAVTSARGGNAGASNGRSGGGGRIAIWRVEDAYFGSYDVTNGTGQSGVTPSATPGTLVFSNLTVAGTYMLNVSARPAQHDSPSPIYGDSLIDAGSNVNASVTSPADIGGGTQYVCIGWALTNAAGPISNDSNTSVSFPMTEQRWLIWYWTNSYYLSCAATTNGTLAVNQTGWYTNGNQVTVTANPDGGCFFLQWSGDVPDADRTNSTITVTMNRPRTILAHFDNGVSETRQWTGSGDWYANYTNWSPMGVPGPSDDVTIGAGVTVRETTRVRSLTVTNGTTVVLPGVNPVSLTVDQSILVRSATLTVSNTPLTCGADLTLVTSATFNVYSGPTNATVGNTGIYIRVAGTLGVGNNCWVKPYSEPVSGGSPIFSVGRLTIEGPNGGFDADAKGFAVTTAPGAASTSSDTQAGAYGGQGGGTTANPKTYGDSNAPVQCGSPGYRSGAVSGRGGGLVRVHADGVVTVNGTISANGQGTSGGYFGSGSGGGIYMTCGGLKGAATGVIRANGGQGTTTDSAGGGGGRIAIYAGGFAYNGTYSVTNGVSIAGCSVQGTPGTLVLGPWVGERGTVFMFR